MKLTFAKFQSRGVKLSDDGDGSAVFVSKDKTPILIASATSAPFVLDGYKQKDSANKNGVLQKRKKKNSKTKDRLNVHCSDYGEIPP